MNQYFKTHRDIILFLLTHYIIAAVNYAYKDNNWNINWIEESYAGWCILHTNGIFLAQVTEKVTMGQLWSYIS